MDETKQPGIGFLAIFVTKLNFEAFPNRQPAALITKVHVQNNFVKDTRRLESNLGVTITTSENIETTLFKLEANVLGVFEEQEGSPLSLKEFSEIQAPALLFPYLREVITTITTKSPIGPVIIPPTNILALIKQGEAHLKGPVKS